jgi:hypothetical protein
MCVVEEKVRNGFLESWPTKLTNSISKKTKHACIFREKKKKNMYGYNSKTHCTPS